MRRPATVADHTHGPDECDPPDSSLDPGGRSGARIVFGLLQLVFLAIYVGGLALWTPLFLCWPRRYHRMTFAQTVATRHGLVRQLWANVRSWFGPASRRRPPRGS